MKHTLENTRVFPYIAWVTIISFAAFTYTLAANLQYDLEHLNNDVDEVETSLENLKELRSNTDLETDDTDS